MEREGTFELFSTAGQMLSDSTLWQATGYVFAKGEVDCLECGHVGGGFRSREEAEIAAIDAARAIARGLPPDDSIRKRNAEFLRKEWEK
ncbi:hypothetical protein GCM10007235_33150 [Pseudoxanthomonas indica]|nr:hypothetical protein GCM10007235_33150 [Pseudoxanthomonas indica]